VLRRLLATDSLVNFLAVNGNVGRGLEAEFHAIPMHFQHDHLDVASNHDALSSFATEDQHGVLLLLFLCSPNSVASVDGLTDPLSDIRRRGQFGSLDVGANFVWRNW
jgi:hypothetical protein